MPRLPYAAKVLRDQVADLYKDPKFEPVGEPDGFGVRRSVSWGNQNTVKFLEKVLPLLDDPRIEGFEVKAKRMEVTFVVDQRADDRRPFDLDDAQTVADNGS